MTDWDLILAYRQESKNLANQALGELYARHHAHLYRMALLAFGDASLAEDAVSEIWIRVIMHISQFRHDAQFSTWLHRIASTTLIDMARVRKRSPTPAAVEGFLFGDTAADPDRHCQTHFRKALIRHALSEIPPKERDIIVMRDIELRSLQEISRILHISVGAAKSRLHRARASFRRELETARTVPGHEAIGPARLTSQGVLH